MTEPRERLRVLADLGAPPDIWERAQSQSPSVAAPPPQPFAKRVVIAALALLVAAAAIGFLVSRFHSSRIPAGAVTSNSVVFAGHTSSDIPTVGNGPFDSVGARDTLFISSAEGGPRIALTDDAVWAGPAAWSRSGDRLAYTTFDLDSLVESLYVFDVATGAETLVCQGCTGTFWAETETGCGIDSCSWPSAYPFPTRLAWSPDGRWLAVDGPPGPHGPWQLIDMIDGTVRPLPPLDGVGGNVGGGDYGGVSWSPDGRLALSVYGVPRVAGLYIFDPATERLDRVFDQSSTVDTPPAWSPDGQTIAMGVRVEPEGTPRGEIWFIDVDTGEARRVLSSDLVGETVRDLEWSPDSSMLAVHEDSLLLIDRVEKSSREISGCDLELESVCPTLQSEISWSPDSREIALIAFDRTEDEFHTPLVSVDIETGKFRNLSGDAFAGCCVAWRPD